MDATLDETTLAQWIGRSESVTQRIDPRNARLMQVTLDREASLTEGDPLPDFWHYIYFNPEVPASRLKEDGHETLGRFLPPVALPRRMWAGGRVEVTRPLRLGETATKTSTIGDVTLKQGRTGKLCFVTVNHEIRAGDELCLTERQDVVYREEADPNTPKPPGRPAPDTADWSRTIEPDSVLLFRYSALLFYAHRIHYDADYTRDAEHYPGLVVHGPLTATLLIASAVEENRTINLKSYGIRARNPLFVTAPFKVEGRRDGNRVQTWARAPDDTIAMSVDLEFAD